MDANDLRIVTNSQLSSNENFTDEELRNAVEVIEILYRWKKELENSEDCAKEAA